jgi:two-component system sensor histidine kinase UhpB
LDEKRKFYGLAASAILTILGEIDPAGIASMNVASTGLQRLQEFTRRLIHAQEEERARLAREIHDDLGNRIALLSLVVGQAVSRQTGGSGHRTQLNEIMAKVADLAHAVRNLSHCLHPPLLKQAGICPALRSLCEEFARSQDVEMEVSIPDRLQDLPDEIELCIFRVSQECLSNIARHARTSEVRVVLEKTPREVRLKVSDTGRGFVPTDSAIKTGLGLINIKERVFCLKGNCEIESAPGAGTRVSVTIPLSKQ